MSEKCNEHSGASMSICPYCKIKELKEEVAKLNTRILGYGDALDRAIKAEAERDRLHQTKDRLGLAIDKWRNRSVRHLHDRKQLSEAIEGLLWALHYNAGDGEHPMPDMEVKAKKALTEAGFKKVKADHEYKFFQPK